VSLWDELGRNIGTTFGTREIAPQGSFIDIKVTANDDVGNIPAAYASITNGGNDAICIAFITFTFPDDTHGTWTGDVGAKCGAQFFESGRQMGTSGDNGKAPPVPKCVWLDRDASLGLKYQGMGFHLRDFFNNNKQVEVYKENLDVMCHSGPRFRMYETIRTEDPIHMFKPQLEYTGDNTDVDISKVINNPGALTDRNKYAQRKVCTDPSLCDDIPATSCEGVPQILAAGRGTVPICQGGRVGDKGKTRRDQLMPSQLNTTTPQSTDIASSLTGPVSNVQGAWRFEDKAVVSAMPEHSARLLCESENSYGPSFAAIGEGLFCEMKTKTLYNIYSGDITSCCFDIDQNQLRGCPNQRSKRSSLTERRQFLNSTTTYTTVQRWGMDPVV
jgi:hypothetical protein